MSGTLALLPSLAANQLRKQLGALRPSTRRARRRARGFDESAGIETRGDLALGLLDIQSRNLRSSLKYQPTPVSDFPMLMERLDIDYSRFVFIDVGAGKGRALCMAAFLPFQQIIGVEFSRELCDIAERNIARFSQPQQRCRDLRTVCLDAAEYQFPPVGSVVYLFNPFSEPVMAQVLRNLTRSLESHPRPVFVVYYNALCRRLFDQCPLFREVASGGPPELGEPWVIYRSSR